ncbi:hypothetical protein QFZ79_003598 [Arthrobacter sp. V4I6]|nr:hypothetical protein [Arthrobacter sp. V1I7]MDQ0855487.1 hypothetical protein [Arthrobacter sp. V4I6]
MAVTSLTAAFATSAASRASSRLPAASTPPARAFGRAVGRAPAGKSPTRAACKDAGAGVRNGHRSHPKPPAAALAAGRAGVPGHRWEGVPCPR